MILESVVIKNIRSHANTEILFERGVTLFAGDIGSGKSSILMAVEFALFGLGSYRADQLLARGQDTGSVTLGFSARGVSYEVRRTLKKGRDGTVVQDPKDCYFAEDGTREDLTPADLKPRIMGVLEFNEPPGTGAASRIFRYAVFTPQDEMRSVLSPGGRRLETVRRAFGIEDYAVAVQNAKAATARIRSLADTARGRFEDIGETERQVAEAREEIGVLETRIREGDAAGAENGRRREAAAAELADLQARTQSILRSNERCEMLRREVSSARSRLEEMTAERGRHAAEAARIERDLRDRPAGPPPTGMTMVQLNAEISRLQEIGERLAAARTRRDTLAADVGRIAGGAAAERDADPAAIRAEIAGIEERIGELSCREDESANEISRIDSEIGGHRHRMERLKSEAISVGEGARCPTCKNTVTREHLGRMDQERREELQYLQNMIGEGEVVRGSAQEGLDGIRRSIRECRDAAAVGAQRLRDAEQLVRQRRQLEEAEAQIRGLERERGGADGIGSLMSLKDGLAEYERVRQRAEGLEGQLGRERAEAARCEEGARQAGSDLAARSAELTGAEGGTGDADSARRAEELKRREVDGIRQDIERNIRELAAWRQRLQDQVERRREGTCRLEEARVHRDLYRGYRNRAGWLENFFTPTLSVMERMHMRSVWAEFRKAYIGWYESLMDDATKSSDIDEEFEPHVLQGRFDQRLEYLSGGERASVALAYRLALNSLMRRMNRLQSGILILDEPTDGFSREQLVKVRQVFSDLGSEQLILVSHNRELEGCADRVITVRKDGGRSSLESGGP